MAPPPAPCPKRIIRAHTAQINVLEFSPRDLEGEVNERLYSGDGDGRVVITSTTTHRTLASWRAHQAGILSIEEWNDSIITHGRDNKLHVWERVVAGQTLTEAASPLEDVSSPTLIRTMDVNALNFCRLSLMRQADASTALIAMPNLVDGALVDIWGIPSFQRLHASVGKLSPEDVNLEREKNGRGVNKTGLIMSLHLFMHAHPSKSNEKHLRLVTAYESGAVCLLARVGQAPTSVESKGWQVLWQHRSHVESVMNMAVSSAGDFALTVSADHLLVRYSLMDEPFVPEERNNERNGSILLYRGKQPGHSAVTIRQDGRICAVAGWDGKVRLYSTKTLKPLGTLAYHKENCVAVCFATPYYEKDGAGGESLDTDLLSENEKERRGRWLVSGGADKRISIWELMRFGAT